MYLVLDTATNNVLGEFASFAEAEQCRVQIVGMNPPLAEYIEVVDLDRAIDDDQAQGSLPLEATAG